VPTENPNGEFDRNELNLTVLFCNAWLRCRAPSAPILLLQRLSRVSV